MYPSFLYIKPYMVSMDTVRITTQGFRIRMGTEYGHPNYLLN